MGAVQCEISVVTRGHLLLPSYALLGRFLPRLGPCLIERTASFFAERPLQDDDECEAMRRHRKPVAEHVKRLAEGPKRSADKRKQAEDPDHDEIERHHVVEQARQDQDQDARNERDKRMQDRGLKHVGTPAWLGGIPVNGTEHRLFPTPARHVGVQQRHRPFCDVKFAMTAVRSD
jgi:hypothetical protein